MIGEIKSANMLPSKAEAKPLTDDTVSPGGTKPPLTHRVPAGTLSMDGPAIYRICVTGVLSSDWSNRLAGMQITLNEGNTILVGRLNDQAALSGVLTALYELHLPVINVEVWKAD